MARGHNNKGRSKNGPIHVRLYEWLLNSEAYRSLHPYSRSLYIELKRKYNSRNNGEISMSILEAQKLCAVGRKAVQRGFTELRDRGFIKLTKQGLFINGQASEWELTEYGLGDKDPTKDFMTWREAK